MISREDAAWLAGIFEGEGCIYLYSVGSISAYVGMTDFDVVERFAALTQVGRMSTVPPNGITHLKPQRCWKANGAEAYAFLAVVFPWLGERRRARAYEAMDRWVKSPHRSRLAASTVRRVREYFHTYPLATAKEAADRFQIAKSTAWRIKTGATYRSVDV